MLFVLAAIAIVTVVVISAWAVVRRRRRHRAPRAEAHAAQARRRRAVAPTALNGARGASYVAVRRGGAGRQGPLPGHVARGQHPPFAGTRFWVNVSTPENLVIKVRGERIRLDGLRPRVVTITPASWHVG